MLEIINKLRPFIEDCYREIGVREYAKLAKISPPTASKLLKSYNKKGLLQKREEYRHLLFSASRTSKDFVDLSRMYWRKKLEPLISELQKKHLNPAIVLFGSLAKAETKKDSDIDLAVFGPEIKTISARNKKLWGRQISIKHFTSLKDIKNAHLRNNILNGDVLTGKLRWE